MQATADNMQFIKVKAASLSLLRRAASSNTSVNERSGLFTNYWLNKDQIVLFMSTKDDVTLTMPSSWDYTYVVLADHSEYVVPVNVDKFIETYL